jgi:hypothetical protein
MTNDILYVPDMTRRDGDMWLMLMATPFPHRVPTESPTVPTASFGLPSSSFEPELVHICVRKIQVGPTALELSLPSSELLLSLVRGPLEQQHDLAVALLRPGIRADRRHHLFDWLPQGRHQGLLQRRFANAA